MQNMRSLKRQFIFERTTKAGNILTYRKVKWVVVGRRIPTFMVSWDHFRLVERVWRLLAVAGETVSTLFLSVSGGRCMFIWKEMYTRTIRNGRGQNAKMTTSATLKVLVDSGVMHLHVYQPHCTRSTKEVFESPWHRIQQFANSLS